MFVAAALAAFVALAGFGVLLELAAVLAAGALRLLAVLVEALVYALAVLVVALGTLLVAGWRRHRGRSLRRRALAGR